MTDFLNTEALKQPEPKDQQGKEGNTESGNNQSTTEGENKPVLEIAGRKYTPEELEKKVLNQDNFIEQLKQERQEDRTLLNEALAELKKTVSAKELLNQVKEGEGNQNSQQTEQAKESEPSNQAVDPNEIARQVREQLNKESQEKEKETNWNQVTSALTEAFGQKVNDKVKEVAEENGFTIEEAVEFAKSKPKAFLRFFDLSKAKPTQRVPEYNSNSFNQRPPDNQAASAFWKANKTKDQVSSYLERLRQLSN